MAKFKPGIPDTFALNVGPVTDLGDYLDEPSPPRVIQRKARGEEASPPAPAALPPEPVVAAPVAVPVVPPPAPVASPQVVAQQPTPVVPPVTLTQAPAVTTLPPANDSDRDREREERGGKIKSPRREISMTPETLRMSDELLELIQSGSGQRDTKANELFHALVLLVYEAMDQVDPHSIPKRGRWGTPTARAYPVEIKNAFLRALLEKHGNGTVESNGLPFLTGSAA